MLKEIKKKKESGFTIIEVMIVLAIAGLIMVVVLVAVPQLQRNQRNTARQSILQRIATEVNNYAGNNNGNIPASQADINGFETRYLSGVDTDDPQFGVSLGSRITFVSPRAGVGVPTGANLPQIGNAVFYNDRRSCDGESLVTASARNFALWIQQEGGAIYCLDNS